MSDAERADVDRSRPLAWSPILRAAFRWSAAYITLYLTPLVPQRLVLWVADRILRLGMLPTGMTGSGDRAVDWVGTLCVFMAASVVAAIWSAFDRRRDDYRRLNAWLRLWVRFALGATLVSYGLMKVIPLQMPGPSLTRLLEPFGQFSPMGVLWASIGASPAYERFAGTAELTAAILLFVPRTALMGALLASIVTCHIFVLNMTYDVPVKLYSFHLMLLSVFLLAPDAPRLANVLLLNRVAPPASHSVLGTTAVRRRLWLLAQIAVGALIVGASWMGAAQSWRSTGGGAPRSALYGIWVVDEMSIDGVTRPPLATDRDRWRRVIFDRPGVVAFQRPDDSIQYWGATISDSERWVQLSGGTSRVVERLLFEQPAPGVLLLDGQMAGRAVSMRLRWVDSRTYPLLSRGFHWVQETPFNR